MELVDLSTTTGFCIFFHVNNSTIYHWLGIDTNYSLGFRNFPGSLKKKWEKAERAHLDTKLPILVMFGTRKVFRVNINLLPAKIQVVKTTIMSTSPAAQQIARSQQSRGLSDRSVQAHRIHRTNGIFFVTCIYLIRSTIHVGKYTYHYHGILCICGQHFCLERCLGVHMSFFFNSFGRVDPNCLG